MKRKYYSDQLVIAAQKNIKEREYWLKKLSCKWEKNSFPYDYKNKTGGSSSERCYHSLEFTFTGDIFTGLMSLSTGNDYALHIILITGFFILLHKYTDCKDLMVGTPIYNQEIPGKFINTLLPLRIQMDSDISFKELLLQTRQTINEAVEHQNYPLEFLFDHLKIPYSENDNFPLLDNLILLENIHDREYISHVNTNMVFSLVRKENRVEGLVEYNSLLYDTITIERLVQLWHNLFQVALFQNNVKVSALDLLLPGEKEQLLSRLNYPGEEDPGNVTITQLFEIQVEKTPHQIAVIFEDLLSHNRQVTYRELNRRANQLAGILKSKGIGANQIVGIILERSTTMIEGILGILKAGGAYLPIDPDFPEKLNLSILEDSNVSVILTGKKALEKKRFSFMQNLQAIKNLPYLTSPQTQIANFDDLPYPDRSSVDYEKYSQYIGQALVKNSVSIQTTRGYPYQCAYCHKIWPRKHVVRLAENIFSEVQLYYNMGIRRFVFIDDTFNMNIRNSERFFQLIIENGLKLQLFFPNGLRGDLLTREYSDLMVKAGTIELALTLENASPRLQKMIQKNLDLDKMRKNIEYFCKKYPHVILELFTMHGFPTETKDEAILTLEFINQFKWIHFPYVHILKIYQNTDMEGLALKNGISKDAIIQSENLAYYESPETVPFDKTFTTEYQTAFLNDYFLSKERLLHVLPYQMQVLTEDEIVQKYNSYLPIEIKNFSDLLDFIGISREQLSVNNFIDKDFGFVQGLNKKMKQHFGVNRTTLDENDKNNSLKVLLLDLSQFFSSESHMLYDVVEPPLGLMYLRSYLKQQFDSKIKVKIAKSRIDFDHYDELKVLIDTFSPHIIGIRTLSFFKDFFHRTVNLIKQWKEEVPIIAGGPYATADYPTMLQDRYIHLAVLGEGELTLCELIGKMLENGGQFPDQQVLNTIPGIAFIPQKNGLGDSSAREIIMWDTLKESTTEEGDNNPVPANTPVDLAYIIFTSGSTGSPKGVMIDHKNVIQLMVGDGNLFDFCSHDVWTMFHSYCFDFSVWEMYGAILYGGKLVVLEKIVSRDPKRTREVLKKHGVTIFNQTPSAFSGLINEELNHPRKDLIKLRYIIFGGEALKEGRLKGWKEKYPGTRLVNMYGITETTIHVTYKEIKHIDIELNKSNIGKPIPTLSAYIMDSNFRLKPIGAPGELFIGGPGVGRGYLNRPEVTNEKFINNPFQPGERFYRSGDRVRLLTSGDMEYLGRIDNQVKIRGFRIELGEIENQLLKHHEIRDVVVVLHQSEGGPDQQDEYEEHYICAYWVPHEISLTSLNTSLLKEYLSRKLPDYMIPAYFVQLTEIPLTSNGKVDTSELPPPEDLINTGVKYQPPTNEIEKKLIEIWQKILLVDKIGINDNFINLGGDSIKAIQVAARLNHDSYKIEIADLFLNPTIKEMAKYVKKMDQRIDQSPVEGKTELTPIQRWLFENDFTNTHHYNQSFMVYSKIGFDEDIIRKVWERLVEHHDALRMVFKRVGKSVVQENRGIKKDSHAQLDFFDLRLINLNSQESGSSDIEKDIEKIATEIQGGINLKEGPLVKVGLFKTDQGDHLLMVIHHLVVDGVSWRILLEDFSMGYQQAAMGKEIKFPDKTDSYKDWAQKLIQYAESIEIIKELDYWREIEIAIPVPLPVEHQIERKKKVMGNREMIHMMLNEKETGLLINEVNKAYNTEINDILLTSLAITMKEWTNLEKVAVNLEGHGREGIIDNINITRTLGWFTSRFPVILKTGNGNNENLGDHIKMTKETLRDIPHKGIGYGIIKYLLPRRKKVGLKFEAEPAINFNYLGDFGYQTHKKDQVFSPSNMKMGEVISPRIPMMQSIDINGLVMNCQLKLSFSYNKYEYNSTTMQNLVEKFKSNLVKIIEYCIQKKRMELTKSDFSGTGFDDEEVESLYEVLEESLTS
jgi:amino acid adenylation domain-containing protein/non-ribosomal peptide synthase protein (TIGR01720 family)